MTAVTAGEVITSGFIAGLFYDHTRHRSIEIYEYHNKYYVVTTGMAIPFESPEKAFEYGESLAQEP